jgi:hypothetical protein
MDGRAVGRWLCNATMLLLAASISSSESLGQVIPASATTVAPSVPTTDIRHLEIGDGYTISIERGGVKKQFNGTLVKATDRWLVLMTVLEGRHESAVPVVSKVPGIGRLFRNVGIGRMNEYVWLPREAATVQGRVIATEPRKIEPPENELPRSGTDFSIQFVQEGKVVDRFGKFTLGEEQITCCTTRSEARVRGVPVLAELPVMGSLFRRTTIHVREVEEQFSWNDVLCITDGIGVPPIDDEE